MTPILMGPSTSGAIRGGRPPWPSGRARRRRRTDPRADIPSRRSRQEGAAGPTAAAPVHAGWRRGVRRREWALWEAAREEQGAQLQAGSTAEEVLPYRHYYSREQQPGEGTWFLYLPPCRWTSYTAPRHGCQGQPPAPCGGDPRRSRRSARARGRAGAPAGRRPQGRLTPRRARSTTRDDAPGNLGEVCGEHHRVRSASLRTEVKDVVRRAAAGTVKPIGCPRQAGVGAGLS
jgi:hypothetical protein